MLFVHIQQGKVSVKSGTGDDAVGERTNELITVHKHACILGNREFKRILAWGLREYHAFFIIPCQVLALDSALRCPIVDRSGSKGLICSFLSGCLKASKSEEPNILQRKVPKRGSQALLKGTEVDAAEINKGGRYWELWKQTPSSTRIAQQNVPSVKKERVNLGHAEIVL